MRIEVVLRQKGDFVATIRPDASVIDALAELAEHGVGALVVSRDGRTPDGVVSERDVARRLNDSGPSILDSSVASIMSSTVRCCAPEDEVESLMATMTTHRIRHVPVLRDGGLVGIVSIGDVVKSRMDELDADRRALVDYINAR
jgi:CBS domain-containing protein